MKYRDENGDFQDLYFKTGDTLPIGTIVSYGSLTAPTNWLVCDGSAVSRTTYADLFAVIGTSYGSGDGSTTFNLPDLRGRVPVGKSTDTEFDTLGETGGEKTHTLTVDELPPHNHSVNQGATTFAGSGYSNDAAQTTGSRTYTFLSIGNTGGDQPHNNLQPYQVVCFIIKAEDAAGVVGNVTNTQSDSTKDTYSCDYINDAIDDAVEDTYSTTEKLTNKVWIDGKPIYRKVITGTITNDDVVLTNVDSLISVCGSATLSGILRVVPFYQFYANQEYILTFNNSANEPNNIKAYIIVQGASSSAYGSNITLEYTKTTD